MKVSEILGRLANADPDMSVWVQLDDDGMSYRELSVVDIGFDPCNDEEFDAAVILW